MVRARARARVRVRIIGLTLPLTLTPTLTDRGHRREEIVCGQAVGAQRHDAQHLEGGEVAGSRCSVPRTQPRMIMTRRQARRLA